MFRAGNSVMVLQLTMVTAGFAFSCSFSCVTWTSIMSRICLVYTYTQHINYAQCVFRSTRKKNCYFLLFYMYVCLKDIRSNIIIGWASMVLFHWIKFHDDICWIQEFETERVRSKESLSKRELQWMLLIQLDVSGQANSKRKARNE